MWGYEAALRVRDRKISEIAKVIGYTNAERRYKLLGELGRDIEICNCTISGSGICNIPSVPVSDPGYRSSLSGTDLEDELDLDSIRVAPPQIRDFIRDMFSMALNAASEDRTEPYRDAVESLKDELASCRDRIDQLSAEMDYKRSELEASEEDRKGLLETIDEQLAEIASLKRRLSDMAEEAEIGHARMEELSTQIEELKAQASEEKPAEQPSPEEPEPVEEQVPEIQEEPAPAEEPVPETKDEPATSEIPASEPASSPAEDDMISRISAMKLTKIDLFMDKMLSGEIDMDECDDLISMLKFELAFLDATRSGGDLGNLPFVAQPSPKILKDYRNSLTEEEKTLDREYKKLYRRAFPLE